MKWNMIVGALVLGLGLCTQPSYGFNLLDSMLGANCGHAASCGCEAVAPSCGCEAPVCGCDSGCHKRCGLNLGLFNRGCCDSACEPACGCAAVAPSCGCEAPCGCDSGCHRRCGLGLLDIFRCDRGCCKPACAPVCAPACGCEAVAPACGCEVAPSCGCAAPCDSCCQKSCCRRGLFDGLRGLFDRPCKSCCHSHNACGCAAPACGCGVSVGVPAAGADEAVPQPPAPLADPSAAVPTGRRVNAAAFAVTK